MATLGFVGLALSCLAGLIGQFGGNPTSLGFLTADGSLPAEMFGWFFFALALLFVARSVAARTTSRLALLGVSLCVLGALFQCLSVGLHIREFILASATANHLAEEVTLLKADFVLAAFGWLALAVGVLVFQRQWANGRSRSDTAIEHAWQPSFLVLSIALLCSAAGAAFGLGSYVEWRGSTSQPVLLISYLPQVLTWIAVVFAALVILSAARRGVLSRHLVVPASLATVGGLVLIVSTGSLLAAVEALYKAREFGWITLLVRIEIVAACVGMLAFAAACIAVATRAPSSAPHSGAHEPRRERSLSAPPYWPRVSSPTAPSPA